LSGTGPAPHPVPPGDYRGFRHPAHARDLGLVVRGGTHHGHDRARPGGTPRSGGGPRPHSRGLRDRGRAAVPETGGRAPAGVLAPPPPVIFPGSRLFPAGVARYSRPIFPSAPTVF